MPGKRIVMLTRDTTRMLRNSPARSYIPVEFTSFDGDVPHVLVRVPGPGAVSIAVQPFSPYTRAKK